MNPPSDTLEPAPQRFMRCITPYVGLNTTWEVVRLFGDTMPNINDYDGYLITGGSAPIVSKVIPETTNVLNFICALHQAKKPLVGICWGHQAICKALGGTVQLSDKGYGMGIKQTQVIKTYDWMEQTADTVGLYSMHQCQVTIPPPEGELYLTSDFCPYAGFTIGKHIMTMQQHPDYNIPLSIAMIHRRRDRLSDMQYATAMQSLCHPHHTEMACRWVGQFLATPIH